MCDNGGPTPLPSLPAQFKYGAELGAPGDEYNKSPGQTAVKRTSMRNALVPGRWPRNFPVPKFN